VDTVTRNLDDLIRNHGDGISRAVWTGLRSGAYIRGEWDSASTRWPDAPGADMDVPLLNALGYRFAEAWWQQVDPPSDDVEACLRRSGIRPKGPGGVRPPHRRSGESTEGPRRLRVRA
jgi:hypothetical protein